MQMPSLMSLIDNNLRPRNSKPWPQTQSRSVALSWRIMLHLYFLEKKKLDRSSVGGLFQSTQPWKQN